MSEGQSSQQSTATEPATPPAAPEPAQTPDRPEPPPYRPNEALIGYIERGQKTPTEQPERAKDAN
jgi:hypothetical protein